MTQNGQPDNARAARYILKDFVQGKLLYCVAPPGVDQDKYHTFKTREKKAPQLTPLAGRAIRVTYSLLFFKFRLLFEIKK